MKRILILELCLLAALSSCTKEGVSPSKAGENGPVQIVFKAKGLDFPVQTKTTPVTSLNSFNVQCTTGSGGSETSVWNISSVNKDNNYYYTGKYWPVTNQGYNFYASNIGITFQSGGSVIKPADMNTDVVYAYKTNSAYKTTCQLTFNHAFSRLGRVTLTPPTGYEIVNPTITITPRIVNGTTTVFNMRTALWSNAVDGSVQTICNSAAAPAENDLWLIPGTYTLTANYTLKKGEWINSYTKGATVVLSAGRVNNIEATFAAGDATEICFNVSLNDWVDQSVAASFQ